MSRKTIPFRIPQNAARPVESESLKMSARGAEADQWVRQSEHTAEDHGAEPATTERKRASALTITISAEPDWFDAWKVAVFLPYAVACYWALGAARMGGREPL